MIIEKIIFKNYRQYRDNEIVFSSKKLNLLYGKMGVGKTNLLNAINWCLYNEEPYLTVQKEEIQLPILNLKTISGSDDGSIEDVLVEIWLKANDDIPVIVTRKSSFILKDKKYATPYNKQEFIVKITNNQGNTEIYKDEQAEKQVNRLFPDAIKDFFFFDGERLDNYFKTADKDTIRQSVFLISQTSLLNVVSENLTKLMQDYRKVAGENNPEIDRIRTLLESNEKNQKETTDRIENLKKQIKISKDNIEKIDDKLSGKPDVNKIRKNINNLKEKKIDKETYHNEKIKEKNILLFENAKIIFCYPAIEKVSGIINLKEERGEIPPTGDKDLLEKILHEKQCRICGTCFSKGSAQEKTVQTHLSGLELSHDVARELIKMQSPLMQYQERVKSYNGEINKISKEINTYEKDLDELIKNIQEQEQRISEYPEAEIARLGQEKIKWEEVRDSNTKNQGVHEGNLKDLIKENERLNKWLGEELEKEKKFTKFKSYIDFIDKSIKVAKNTKETIMEKVRKEISTETEKKFFDLMWKEKSFSTVSVNEEYEIKVKNYMGLDCLGSLSGGEREVLALSFTMALHNISGFNAPILIDRPLTMVSGEPIDYVSEAFLNISKLKQLILFLTPNEYKEVSSFLNSKSCNVFELNLSQDEKEIKISEV